MKQKQILERTIEKEFVKFLNRGQPPYEKIVLKKDFPRVKAILEGKIVPPYEVEIQPSSICNLDCSHCFGDDFPVTPKLMDKREIKILAQRINDFQANGFKIETAKFCGTTGEPLLTPIVAEGIKLFKKFGKKIILYTNGLNLDQRVNGKPYYDYILEIDRLNLSLDAGSEEIFTRLKGKPGFNRIIKSLENLVKNRNSNLNIVVSYVISKKNYTDIVPTAELIRKIGADELSYRVDFTNLKEIRTISREIINFLEEAKQFSTKKFHVNSAYSRDDISSNDSAFKSKGRKCFTHYFWASISPSCELYTCGHRTHNKVESYGNLLNHSFRELWISKERQESIKQLPDKSCIVCSPFSYRINDFMGFLSTLPIEEVERLHKKYIQEA